MNERKKGAGWGCLLSAFLLALPPKAKDIVFRFIIEYIVA
jgi:hypothetical protein